MSTLPAMRIKSRWFKPGETHDAAEQAGVMAFIVWRVSHQMLKRMRGADFDIDAGPAYFAFMREVLVFLVAVTDRMAHQRLDEQGRHDFTVALVRHLVRTYDENLTELYGAPRSGEPDWGDALLDQINEVVAHYAEFGADPHVDARAGFTPDFGFVRYLGRRLEPVVPEKDRLWVIDQVMAIEVPEALDIVQRSMHELWDPTPRPVRRRAGMSGE
ncbi:MAG: hypothetical protein IPG93_21290 [Burkholderiales bacterium]|nr:hypothetical protein [Burkholderiales bacterium]